MKTKGQKIKSEKNRLLIQKILKLLGLILLISAGIIYYNSLKKEDEIPSIRTDEGEVYLYSYSGRLNNVSSTKSTDINSDNKAGNNSDNISLNKSYNKSEIDSEMSSLDVLENDSVNKLKDGSEDKNERSSENGADINSGNDNRNSTVKRININTAGISELCTLKGIGPSKAQKIIDFRNINGPFSCIEDIMKIPGIKEGVFRKISESICVGDGG